MFTYVKNPMEFINLLNLNSEFKQSRRIKYQYTKKSHISIHQQRTNWKLDFFHFFKILLKYCFTVFC